MPSRHDTRSKVLDKAHATVSLAVIGMDMIPDEKTLGLIQASLKDLRRVKRKIQDRIRNKK